MKVSERVQKLEKDHEASRSLCGTILATIIVNRRRGTLMLTDAESEATFDEMVEEWDARRKNLLPVLTHTEDKR